jgi:moderate conductance mechanosensitive channel
MAEEQEDPKIEETVQKDMEILKKRAEEKKEEYRKKNRRQKISAIVSLVLFAGFLVSLNLYIFARQIWGDEIGDQFFGAGVSNGFVYFWQQAGKHLLGTGLAIAICFIVIFISSSLLRLFGNKSKKSKTVTSLIRSVIKYLAILITMAVVLGIWGVDVSSIVAGIGVLTLIIGLGCQSLIQDVVSGLFIVFDDYFNVGDIVIVDGFRGTVQDIGLRTVKINDGLGDIKAITNSSINTVVNLSRSPNFVYLTMDVSYNEDLERVEGIIAKALPAIKAKLPQITDGPYYKGVDGFDDAGINLGFCCFCKVENRFQVKRDLQREFYQLFNDNDILFPYQQITVNQADPDNRPKATPEQKKRAEEINKANSAVPEDDTEKTFLEKARDNLLHKTDDSDD